MACYTMRTYEERTIIQKMWNDGAQAKEIADKLEAPLSTIYSELRRACMFLDPVSPPTAEAVEARDTLGAAKKRLWNKLQTVEREAEEAAEIERLETALQTVVGVVTANRMFEIIRREPEEKHAAFLKTTLEAALGGADYSACTTLDDMGNVFAKYFVERAGGV